MLDCLGRCLRSSGQGQQPGLGYGERGRAGRARSSAPPAGEQLLGVLLGAARAAAARAFSAPDPSGQRVLRVAFWGCQRAPLGRRAAQSLATLAMLLGKVRAARVAQSLAKLALLLREQAGQSWIGAFVRKIRGRPPFQVPGLMCVSVFSCLHALIYVICAIRLACSRV